MKRVTLPVRAFAVLCGGLVGASAVGAAPVSAAVAAAPMVSLSVDVAESILSEPFYADSGDPCPLGLTRGKLRWIDVGGPRGAIGVEIVGVVVDRPTGAEPAPECGDPRSTTAAFTTYHGKTVVAAESVRVDDGELDFRARLPEPFAERLSIDLLVVQVCRHAPAGMGLHDYCGVLVEYRPPPLRYAA